MAQVVCTEVAFWCMRFWNEGFGAVAVGRCDVKHICVVDML